MIYSSIIDVTIAKPIVYCEKALTMNSIDYISDVLGIECYKLRLPLSVRICQEKSHRDIHLQVQDVALSWFSGHQVESLLGWKRLAKMLLLVVKNVL